MDNKEKPLQFNFDSTTMELTAVFTPSEKPLKHSNKSIIGQITEAGYGDFLIYDSEIKILVQYINSHTECSCVIAKKTDAMVEVWVSHDAMRAYLTSEPAHGGEPLTEDKIRDIIKNEGIETEIDQKVINDLLAEKQLRNKLFTSGKYPIKQIITCKRLINKEINKPTIIELDTQLLEKQRTSYKKTGHDVFMNEIKPIPEPFRSFDKNLLNISTDPNNNKILVAKESGHPVFIEDYVKLDKPEKFTSVNKKEHYNVCHDGSIFIDGDVTEGVKIKASGDIIVNGAVGSATLESGGDIIISQGVVGGALTNDNEHGAKIIANGQVVANFLDNTYVTAGKEILIQEYVCHSSIYSNESIEIGINNGSGKLIGGKTYSRLAVKAKHIGTQAQAPGNILIHTNEKDLAELKKYHEQLIEKDIELNALRTALAKLEISTKDMLPASIKAMKEPIIKDIGSIILSLANIASLHDSCLSRCEESEQANIVATENLYGGTTITLQKLTEKVIKDMTEQKISIANNTINYQSLQPAQPDN